MISRLTGPVDPRGQNQKIGSSKTRNLRLIWFFVGFTLLWPLAPTRVAASETKTFVAFSMREAQARVKEARRSRQDFRKQPDLFYLGSITKPWAIVYDPESNDWILVGERYEKSPILTLDDWAVALQARFLHGDEDPGVTIEPRGKASSVKRQDVRYFGGISGTYFGRVCFDADWLMKKLGLGLYKIATHQLKTYYDLVMEERSKFQRPLTSITSRFWFYPIVSRVNVSDKDFIVLLEQFQMGVFTEVLEVEINGEPIVDLSSFEHNPADEYARSFSENYDSLAEDQKILGTLRGFTQLAALAKGLTVAAWRPEVGFWLREYLAAPVATFEDEGVEILSRMNSEADFAIYGGAQLAALAMRLRGGDFSAFRDLVLTARNNPKDLVWEFQIELNDGIPTNCKLPQRLTTPNQVWPLWTQALFLDDKKRYKDVIKLYTNITQYLPEWYAVFVNRGIAYYKLGLYGKAFDDLSHAIELNPQRIESHNTLAMIYHAQKLDDKALAEFEKILKIDSSISSVYRNRGMVYASKKFYRRALEDYNKSLELDGKDANLYITVGNIYNNMENYEDAIKNYNHALNIDPNLSLAYYNREISYEKKNLYLKALSDFNAAIRLSPRVGYLYVKKATVLEKISGLDEALGAYKSYIDIMAGSSKKDADIPEAQKNVFNLVKERIKEIEEGCKKYPWRCRHSVPK